MDFSDVEPTEVTVGVIVGEDLRPVAGMRSGVWPSSPLPAAVVPIAAIEDPASATQALIEAGFEVEIVLVRGEVAPDGPHIRAYRLDHPPVDSRVAFFDAIGDRAIRVVIG